MVLLHSPYQTKGASRGEVKWYKEQNILVQHIVLVVRQHTALGCPSELKGTQVTAIKQKGPAVDNCMETKSADRPHELKGSHISLVALLVKTLNGVRQPCCD